MQKDEYRAWLEKSHSDKATTNRVSRAGRVERSFEVLGLPYRDLDAAYNAHHLDDVLEALRAATARARAGEQPPPPLVQSSTKPDRQLARLMNAVQNYRRFRDEQAAGVPGSWPELETMRLEFLERVPDFDHFERRDGTYWEDERSYKDGMLAQAAAAAADASNSDVAAGHAVYDALLPGSGPPLRWQTIDAIGKSDAGLATEFDAVIGRLARSSAPIADALMIAIREMEALKGRGLSPLSKGEILAIAFSIAAATRPKESAFFRVVKAQSLVKRLGTGPSFAATPVERADIEAWLALLQRIFTVMRDEWRWRPRDLLDAQGFVWVVLDDGWAADDDEPPFVHLYDTTGNEYEPARQVNQATNVSTYRIKPAGATNETADAVETQSLEEVARAVLLQGRPVRVSGGAGAASYVTYGPGRKLQRYEISAELAEALGIPAVGSAAPADADRIRQLVFDEYIKPARAAGRADVTVLVRDVNDRLGLRDGWPNICQALEGKIFRTLAGVDPPERIGAPQSSATKFRFTLQSTDGSKVQPDPTNLILYGPPGTGKTYATAAEAVRLCGETVPADRNELMQLYAALVRRGRIEFVTFHQSYAYEDFVEGLRPVTGAADDLGDGDGGSAAGGFSLKPRDGVFKRIADLAAQNKGVPVGQAPPSLDRTAKVFKMSLGRSGAAEDDHIYEDAIREGHIMLGYGGDIDWSAPEFDQWDAIAARWRQMDPEASGYDPNITQIYTLRCDMDEGSLVIVSDGNLRFRAIGEIIGPYYRDTATTSGYSHRRKVRWLWHGESLPRERVYAKRFSQVSAYRFNSRLIDWDALEQIVAGGGGAGQTTGMPEPYVLVIDEINRANISKVFGELITLLEPDKRLGKSNALTVKLPYSGDPFGVPANLHIVGTMNTADRSIALLDTALRRRFEFQELMPRPELLGTVDGIDLTKLLATINERIEYLFDREHQIGHAYFIGCLTRADIDGVMRQRIIPLLAEYFYEDWSRVAAVLGDADESEVDRVGGFLIRKALQPPKGVASLEAAGPRFRWTVRTDAFDYARLQ